MNSAANAGAPVTLKVPAGDTLPAMCDGACNTIITRTENGGRLHRRVAGPDLCHVPARDRAGLTACGGAGGLHEKTAKPRFRGQCANTGEERAVEIGRSTRFTTSRNINRSTFCSARNCSILISTPAPRRSKSDYFPNTKSWTNSRSPRAQHPHPLLQRLQKGGIQVSHGNDRTVAKEI